MKSFVYLTSAWLLAIALPPTLDPDRLELLQAVTLLWLPVIGLIAAQGQFLLGPVFTERMSVLALTSASLVAISASALLSEDPVRSLSYVAAAAVGLISCAGLWKLIGHRMTECLSLYAIVGSGFGVYILAIGLRVQGRLSISMTSHPNYLGLIAFSLLICSLAVPNRILSAGLIALNFVIIVGTESRSALVAAFLGLLVYFTIKVTRGRKGSGAFTICGTALVLAVLMMTYWDTIGYWVSSLLFLNDKYRGLGTGFTGRLEAWQEAFDLFQSNPWFGVGFRMHERYMTTLSSAHNGYLSLLAEVGLVGTIALVSLTLVAGSRLLRRALYGDPMAILGLSFVVGYLFLATFERFFLNMGNPTSVLAWLFLLMPERIDSQNPSRAPADPRSPRPWLIPKRAP